MSPETGPRPPEEAIQDARLGPGNMFVLQSPRVGDMTAQASALFDAVAGIVTGAGGWLIDDMVRLQKHLYTIDVFNPANELMLPYDDPDHRYWAIHVQPPNVLMPDATFAALLLAAAKAVGATYGFGGQWLAQAIYAYLFAAWSDNDYLKPLDPAVRLADLAYPYMLLRSTDLTPEVIERLGGPEFATRRAGKPDLMATCDRLGAAGEYVFLRLGPLFPDADEALAARAAEALDRTYVKAAIVRERAG